MSLADDHRVAGGGPRRFRTVVNLVMVMKHFPTHHFLFNCHIHLLNASTFQLASWFHCDLPTPSCITIAEASLPNSDPESISFILL